MSIFGTPKGESLVFVVRVTTVIECLGIDNRIEGSIIDGPRRVSVASQN